MSNNWIKISDNIPEQGKEFIALWDNGDICIETWNNYEYKESFKESFHKHYDSRKHKILYWQPMPECPEGFKIKPEYPDSGSINQKDNEPPNFIIDGKERVFLKKFYEAKVGLPKDNHKRRCSDCGNDSEDIGYFYQGKTWMCKPCFMQDHANLTVEKSIQETIDEMTEIAWTPRTQKHTSNMISTINGEEVKKDEKLIKLKCINCNQIEDYKIKETQKIENVKCGNLGYDHDKDIFKFCGFTGMLEEVKNDE